VVDVVVSRGLAAMFNLLFGNGHPLLPESPTWPILIYFAVVLIVAGAMIGISYLLGQRHKERATGEPFESGIVSTGTPQIHFMPHFYLIAMIFVIFDLETVFIFAYALAAKQLKWPGFLEILIFISVLLAALLYIWRMGVLEAFPRTRKPLVSAPVEKKTK
jgi:NADH-quinone oxidoreductase subunit A